MEEIIMKKGIRLKSISPNLFAKQKGITPVISIVLLLLIVIAIIGIAFGWFVGIFGTATEAGQEGIESAVGVMNKRAALESVNCGSGDNNLTVYIKASGSSDLEINEVSIYLNNELLGTNSVQIASGTTEAENIIGSFNCTTGTIRIIDPAGVESKKTLGE